MWTACQPRDLELLQSYVDHPSDSTVLILVARKADLRKKPFSGLHSRGAAFDFAPMNEELLPGWIADRVQARGGTIDEEGADLLAAYVGSSLREIDNEIEKLLTFVGKGNQVTAQHVADLVGFSREFTIFELQNAIGQGNLPRALKILEHMLRDRYPVVLLMSMLTIYFANIWKLHHYLRISSPPNRGELMSKLRFSPRVLRILHGRRPPLPRRTCRTGFLPPGRGRFADQEHHPGGRPGCPVRDACADHAGASGCRIRSVCRSGNGIAANLPLGPRLYPQLLWSASGVHHLCPQELSASTPKMRSGGSSRCSWPLFPQESLWKPPNCAQVRYSGRVSIRCLT